MTTGTEAKPLPLTDRQKIDRFFRDPRFLWGSSFDQNGNQKKYKRKIDLANRYLKTKIVQYLGSRTQIIRKLTKIRSK